VVIYFAELESTFIEACTTEIFLLVRFSFVQSSPNGLWPSGIEDSSEQKSWTTKEFQESNVKAYQGTM
jgi:hypothetical protein